MSEKYVVRLKNAAIYHADNPFGSTSAEKLMRRGEMVLSDVNLCVAPGEFVYLIGRVGSGKSTLLKTLYAEVQLLSGEGRVAGYDLRRLRRRDIPYLRRRIGIVFQVVATRRKPRLAEIVAAAVILGGTLLASGLFSDTVGHLDPLGILCALLSAVSCATFMFLSARVGCDLPPIERGLVVCLGACILGFAVCPDYFSSGALQTGIWKYGLILGVFGLFVPVVLFGIGTPHLSAGLSTIMASSELPCGIAISVLVLSEPVDALQTAGIAVIMLGVAVSQLPNLLPQGASARFRKKRLQ